MTEPVVRSPGSETDARPTRRPPTRRRPGTTASGRVPSFPLAEYGVIGNNRTALLVHRSGSIDWACFPRFDSDPVFSALLNPGRGGHFRLGPKDARARCTASYETGTNILQHVYGQSDGARLTVLDFCPEVDSDQILMSEVHRRLTATHGPVQVRLEFAPRFDFGRVVPRVQISPDGALATAPEGSVSLVGARPLTYDARRHVVEAEFTLAPGEEEWFVMSYGPEVVTPLRAYRSPQRLRQTVRYWREWSSESGYHGRWRREIERSALLLKLLFYRPTGAMVAAPTTSLPERTGGERNWDYRYSWVRDTALAVRSLFRLGYTREAVAFVYWMLGILERDATGLRVLYTVTGDAPAPEHPVPGLRGYAGSLPVRVGNAAAGHDQHDLIGYVLEVADLLDSFGGVISVELWRQLRHLVNHVVTVWRSPDRGIWEVRGPPRHYVYSKAMSWFALDRGLDVGRRLGFVAPYDDWERERAEIARQVLAEGTDPSGRELVWYYGASGPDASLLRLPILGFLDPHAPVMRATVERIERDLRHGPFLRRYSLPDGLPPGEGYFVPCSFWLVEYYTQAGQLEKARHLLEDLLARSTPLELWSEMVDEDGEFLGNFPQALSHLALILAATSLDEAIHRRQDGRGTPPAPLGPS